jgi:hypothetical protein
VPTERNDDRTGSNPGSGITEVPANAGLLAQSADRLRTKAPKSPLAAPVAARGDATRERRAWPSETVVLRLAAAAEIDSLGGASDTGVLLYHRAVLIGWADDYGTVTHPDHELDAKIKTAAEKLVAAVGDFWEAVLA